MSGQIIGLLILLLLSGFFSSSEIAFVIANKIKVEVRARKNNLAARNALHFVKNPAEFFSVILISNNIVNITFASIATIVLNSVFHLTEMEILLLTTALILLFGELIPKYIGRELADLIVLFSAMPLRIIAFVFFPIIKIFTMISEVLLSSKKMKEQDFSHLYDKEDLQHLLEESSEAGNMDEADSDIITKIMEIREQRVYEAMTPRTAIVGIEISSTMEEVLNVFIESGYSKLPVYEENLDNIKGMVFKHDLFKNPDELKTIIKNVTFVPDTKKSLEMLNEFLKKRFSIAVVVDEFGGTAGILTVEDLIEELFGEIRDEYDVDETILKKLDDSTFIISGKYEVDLLNEEHNLGIPEGDYETLGGYLTFLTGRIPQKGEIINSENFSFLILRSDKTKIDLVKLTINPAV